jgi:8-oxo-dGTP diphosphatase
MALEKAPKLTEQQMLSASCHSKEELKQAEGFNTDFVFLSPVNQTSSHPELTGMGWDKFRQLVTDINRPVYALGGMSENDVRDARQYGGQGIAAITGLWVSL